MIKILKKNINFNIYFVRKYILGIETSCDDTGAAIIDNSGDLVSEHVESQINISSRLGGIIPTVARQLHLVNIDPCIQKVVKDAHISFNDLSAIALTVKPGLGLSLAVGRDYAVALANKFNLPIIPIHHMEAHALMVRMFDRGVQFPFMILLISGGNSILGVAQSVDEFLMLGTKLDMSPGDCLDKIARMLHLVGNNGSHTIMSGGRAIELLALENKKELIKFTVCRSQAQDCNFSFSGIEGAVTGYLESLKKSDKSIDIAHISASVLYTMGFQICRKIQRAMMYCHRNFNIVPTTLVVSGGVASNMFFRSCFQKVCDDFEYRLICPPVKYCTDNGVMIAWNGYELFQLGKRIVTDLSTIDYNCRVPFGEDISKEVSRSSIRLPKLKLKSLLS